MNEGKNALIERISRRVDRAISKNESSLEVWVNYQFNDVAQKVDLKMRQAKAGGNKKVGAPSTKNDRRGLKR
jgi:hypothetical protein